MRHRVPPIYENTRPPNWRQSRQFEGPRVVGGGTPCLICLLDNCAAKSLIKAHDKTELTPVQAAVAKAKHIIEQSGSTRVLALKLKSLNIRYYNLTFLSCV
jgi:hypothetical protein